MGTVEVKGLKFHAFHGCHPEERKTGGTFEVDIVVDTDISKSARTDDLSETIDYVALMDISSQEMLKPRDLIETVAQDIAERIKNRFEMADRVEVKIKKHCAPVTYQLDYVAVKAVV